MSEELEYTIKSSDRGYAVSGPALQEPSVFDSESKAIAFARYAIGGRSGFITRIDGNGYSDRQTWQGSRHLTTDGAFKR